MTKQEKLQYCGGCQGDFYNGNNPYGIKECWHLKTSKLANRDLYLSIKDITTTKVKTLSCFKPILKR